MKTTRILSCALFGLSFLANNAFAQEANPPAPTAEDSTAAAAEKKEEKIPDLQPGVVASYGRTAQNTAIDVETSGAAPGDEASPVVGGIKRLGGDDCEVFLKNNSKKAGYSVSFAVEAFDRDGSRQSRRTYSASLSPSGSTSRSVRCPEGQSMQVVISSGRALKRR